MDTVLREIGIGDLSVPKKVRGVAAAHAALLEDLERAFTSGDAAIAASLESTLPSDQYQSGASSLRLAHYVRETVSALVAQSVAALGAGEVKFPELGSGGGSKD